MDPVTSTLVSFVGDPQLKLDDKNRITVPSAWRRKFLRLLHAQTRHGAPDTQGRLVLPLDLCEMFVLKDEVVLVGNEGRFEVWNVDRWQQTAAADEAIFDHVGNLIGL